MKKTIVMVTILCLILTLITGCSSEPAKTMAVGFVLGNTSVFPSVSLSSASDIVYSTFRSYGNVAVFIADGQPSLEKNFQPNKPDKATENQRDQTAEKQTKAALSAMSSFAPTDPETDLLAAVTMAANSLRSGGTDIQELVIFSSGLSTAGVLNFAASNLLEADAEALTEQLKRLHAIPDLTGVEVTFRGLGQTAGHQSSMDESNIYKLETIWRAILEAGNPASLTIDRAPLPNAEPAEGLPYCSPVTIINNSISAGDVAETIDEETVLRLDISFNANETTLADPVAAQADIQAISEQLMSSSERILLVGSIASSPSTDQGVALSTQRAETVKSLLVAQGLEAEKIRCIGMGCKNWPLRVNDLDENGDLIEEYGAKNRTVYLMTESNPLVSTLDLN